MMVSDETLARKVQRLEAELRALREQAAEGKQLNRFSRALHEVNTIPEVMAHTYESLTTGSRALPISSSSILRPRKQRVGKEGETIDTLLIESIYPDNIEMVGYRVPFGKGVTGRAAQSKSPTSVSRIGDASPKEYINIPERSGEGSEIAVPLLDNNGELIGVFEAQSEASYVFDSYAKGFLSEIGRTLSKKLVGIADVETDDLCDRVQDKATFNKSRDLEILYALKNDYNLSFAALDIDDFKLINDTYGHMRGDEVIAQFGNALRDYGRESDLFFRIGGDEYAILLPDTDYRDAREAVERLAEGTRQETGLEFSYGLSSLFHFLKPFRQENDVVPACPDTVAQLSDDLYREADEDLYKMKAEKKA